MTRRIGLTRLALAVLALALLVSACAAKPVATVNGEAIDRKEFDARVAEVRAQYAYYGMDVSAETLTAIKQDVLEQMIDEMLLLQGAKASGIVVSAEEIESYYSELAAGYADEAAFLAAAKENGFTEQSLREEIGRYLLIVSYQEQHVKDTVDPAALAVTEAEMRSLYATYAEQIDDIPPFEEVAVYLEQELRDQKLSDLGVYESLIEGLREAAAIERNL